MDNQSAVSVVIDRTVLPGKNALFEEYLKNIIDAASKYPGHMGGDVIKPQGDNRYILVFRFASQQELDKWSASQERNYWVNKIDQVIEKPTQLVTLTGLETWFYLPKGEDFVPPPKYKMALITYFAIAPTTALFHFFFGDYFSSVPEHFISFATAPFIIVLMTFLVMPLMTRLFKGFLYPGNNVDTK